MSETKVTASELERMTAALPIDFLWSDPLDAYMLREILSAMGHFDLFEALSLFVGDGNRKYTEIERQDIARAALAKALGEGL